MTEKEFLEKREPFWLEPESLKIMMPTNSDKCDVHAYLSKKYSYGWMFTIRGYIMPEEHFAMLYTADYETPNITMLVCQYLFNYFPGINWIGLGCHKGKIGEIWKPKMVVAKDINLIKDDC
jgi:hypothetical protein